MKNNNLVQSFAFQSNNVRVIEINNDPWFVLRDVLGAIASETTVTAAETVICDSFGEGFVSNQPLKTSGGMQNVTVIHEAAVTLLISRSRTEMGRAFNRHLHAVILPTIRKTGKFVAHPEIESAPQPRTDHSINSRKIDLQISIKKLEIEIAKLEIERVDINYCPANHPPLPISPAIAPPRPVQTELDIDIVQRYNESKEALLKAKTIANEYKALSITPKPKNILTSIDNIESVQAYIRDRTKLDPSAKVYIGKADGNPATHFYPNYINYCVEQGLAFVTMQAFSKVLMQLVYTNMEVRLFKGKDAKGCHVKGIAIAA